MFASDILKNKEARTMESRKRLIEEDMRNWEGVAYEVEAESSLVRRWMHETEELR